MLLVYGKSASIVNNLASLKKSCRPKPDMNLEETPAQFRRVYLGNEYFQRHDFYHLHLED